MAPSSISSVDSIDASDNEETVHKDFSWYLPLYKATLAADWEAAQKFFEKDKDAISAKINTSSQTILHIAVEGGKSHIHFVEKLVEALPKEALSLQNSSRNVPLASAARVGNTAAARILVKKDPDSVYSRNTNLQYLPLHVASSFAHKETLLYLLSITKEDADPSPFEGRWGYELLTDVIIAEFYDIALDLVQRYPKLVTTDVGKFDTPLLFMAKKTSAFPSGCQLNFWQRFVYSGLRVNIVSYSKPNDDGDVEKAADRSELANKTGDTVPKPKGNYLSSISKRLHYIVSEGMGSLVPHIRQKKLVHQQALQLVKAMCEAIKSTNHNRTFHRCAGEPFIQAAKTGTREVMEEIVDAMPSEIWQNRDGHYLFQLAVINRCEEVFNLIYQMRDHKQRLIPRVDRSRNNILHLAGQLAPPHKLHLVSGAAFQMQREIQWFKEVEKFATPALKEKLNSDNDTPAMVFTKSHYKLVEAGEKWMKDTANSCTIAAALILIVTIVFAAALIVTIVFAAAITMPGGNDNQEGFPIFFQESRLCNISHFRCTFSIQFDHFLVNVLVGSHCPL